MKSCIVGTPCSSAHFTFLLNYMILKISDLKISVGTEVFTCTTNKM